MKPIELKNGDVVQINPEIKDSFFAGCLMVVTEPKSFGAQGYVKIPGKRGEQPRHAYCRIKFEDMEFVGHAVWIVE